MSAPPPPADGWWNFKALIKLPWTWFFEPIAKFITFGTKANTVTVVYTVLFMIGWAMGLGSVAFGWGFGWNIVSAIVSIFAFINLDPEARFMAFICIMALAAGFVPFRLSQYPITFAYCVTTDHEVPTTRSDGKIVIQHVELTTCRQFFASFNLMVTDVISDNHTYIGDEEHKVETILHQYKHSVDMFDKMVGKLEFLNQLHERKIQDVKRKTERPERGVYTLFTLVKRFTDIVEGFDSTLSQVCNVGGGSVSTDRNLVMAVKSGIEAMLEFIRKLETGWGDRSGESTPEAMVVSGRESLIQAKAPAITPADIDGGGIDL